MTHPSVRVRTNCFGEVVGGGIFGSRVVWGGGRIFCWNAHPSHLSYFIFLGEISTRIDTMVYGEGTHPREKTQLDCPTSEPCQPCPLDT